MHVDVGLGGILCVGKDNVNEVNAPVVDDGHDKDKADSVPGDNWGIGRSIVNTFD